jgi:hypothetical protein
MSFMALMPGQADATSTEGLAKDAVRKPCLGEAS